MQREGGGDPAVAWVAARLLGLITAEQAQVAGLNRGAIANRLRRGSLHRVHRGVYGVGHPTPIPRSPELAAVLACGAGVVVSHRSAARGWGLWPEDEHAPVEVTMIGGRRRSRSGLLVRHTAWLDPVDRTISAGLPVTAPARTLLDVAAVADLTELERGVANAHAPGLVTATSLLAATQRSPTRAGAAALRACVAGTAVPPFTRSEAERRMIALIVAANLPRPIVNGRVARFEVDFLWPAQRLAVEVDGFRFHGHRGAFERDRRKGLALAATGYRVIRITWRQLIAEPVLVAVQLSRALDAPR